MAECDYTPCETRWKGPLNLAHILVLTERTPPARLLSPIRAKSCPDWPSPTAANAPPAGPDSTPSSPPSPRCKPPVATRGWVPINLAGQGNQVSYHSRQEKEIIRSLRGLAYGVPPFTAPHCLLASELLSSCVAQNVSGCKLSGILRIPGSESFAARHVQAFLFNSVIRPVSPCTWGWLGSF